jgi:hypothetical protein
LASALFGPSRTHSCAGGLHLPLLLAAELRLAVAIIIYTIRRGGHLHHQVPSMGVAKHHNQIGNSLPHLGYSEGHFSPCYACVFISIDRFNVYSTDLGGEGPGGQVCFKFVYMANWEVNLKIFFGLLTKARGRRFTCDFFKQCCLESKNKQFLKSCISDF